MKCLDAFERIQFELITYLIRRTRCNQSTRNSIGEPGRRSCPRVPTAERGDKRKGSGAQCFRQCEFARILLARSGNDRISENE